MVRNWMNHAGVRRIAVLAIIVLLLFMLRSMMNIMLLTLLLTILIGSIYNGVNKLVKRFVNVPSMVVLLLVYGLLILIMVWGVYRMVPLIIVQVKQVYLMIQQAYMYPDRNQWNETIIEFMDTLNVQRLFEPGLSAVMKVSQLGTQLLVSIILSLFFLMEKSYITRFTATFVDSKLGWFFKEVGHFGRMFLGTFGKVLEAQLLISLINCILTTIALWIMGFPNLLGLALIIFVLGLVPVAGVFISLAPLGLIAFSVGGIQYVIYLVILIVVIHAIEAYFLNPKLMSSKTNLPIFFTFVVLIFSEHLIGIWGLIVGIPLFVFFLDLIGIKRKQEKDT
ncbi:AI-2E family transporter [Paenibacillus sp. FSL M8-0228]|jgi:predicted PurR-regulated permease PerM|uniref:AI-2E family transporter n=1 Tax=Paenibacillus polymyxa TaxID=1406 RepID=A0A8I1LSG9_PAEPO|nr:MULTISPECIES: AI-2E family transporter [Paenibacillus]KAF6573867.1 AI-2E family transporter [Paenibacillus sp. EKM206P]KAF6588248.1 AI-2E family transporter [Paenibacillus sp. EKM205P]KEO79837.1 membrane protein [Paenibacillus polymyxa]MBM0635814.1 AI-2E family transporter [Paenibacillus polymyxa]MBO3282927.1 AI-2E family transporter [Paenibacillus polymyxa]